MSDVINLNKVRKLKNREDKAFRAAQNRVKFGRTKAEKVEVTREEKTKTKGLDSKLLPDGSGH